MGKIFEGQETKKNNKKRFADAYKEVSKALWRAFLACILHLLEGWL
jgi:hypothetical protein